MAVGLSETVQLPKNQPLIAGGIIQSRKSPRNMGDTEPLKMEFVYTNSTQREEEKDESAGTDKESLEREWVRSQEN